MGGNELPQLRLLELDFGRGWAGGQTQSFALAQGLAQRGHKVMFVCRNGSIMAERLANTPIETIKVPIRGRLDISALLRLKHVLQETNPHIIHMHDSVSFWLGSMAAGLSRTKAALIVHKRTDHSPGKFGRLRYCRAVDRVIAISKGAEGSLTQVGVPPAKVATIYSSVDCDQFQPDERAAKEFRNFMNLTPEWPLIGAIGSLVPRKDHNTLLQAAPAIIKDFPETRFIICGSGELRESLQATAEQLGIQHRVIFMGECSNVKPILAALDIFVMPSLMEGLGVAALEAMAMGKPVIASRVGGLAEVVENICTGFLIQPGTPEVLAEAVLKLLHDPALRLKMGKAARERAENIFSRQRMIEQTEELYYECLT